MKQLQIELRGVSACVGAVLISIEVPCLLVIFHVIGEKGLGDTPGHLAMFAIAIHIAALIGCGPGALILAYFLFLNAQKKIAEGADSPSPPVAFCAVFGAFIAFLNFPAYSVVVFLTKPLLILKVGALFSAAGATAGAWIAWHAFRITDETVPFWPRFSIRTLLLVVIGWGLLMALFAPKPIPLFS